MALQLFNPKTGSFQSITPAANDLPFGELLLLNILIELKTLNHYMQEQQENGDQSSDIRTDIVSVN
jgi:hypothetical protein